MTLTEFQTYLHSLYQGDGDTPTSSSDEWLHRRNLGHAAVAMWEQEPGMLWDELWSNLSDSATGDKTATTSTLVYDMPDDYSFLGAYVRTTNAAGQHTYYEVIKPEKAELYKNASIVACYVTGNESSGFKLNFCVQPAVGDTINYPYYKKATAPTATTDVFQMRDPWFAVYFALAKLHEFDGDGDRANVSYAMATERLRSMKIKNSMLPHYQENSVPDRDFSSGRGGFGI